MEWISVDQDRPKDARAVIACHAPNGLVFTASMKRPFGDGEPEVEWYDNQGLCRSVTHWMPFPKPVVVSGFGSCSNKAKKQ